MATRASDTKPTKRVVVGQLKHRPHEFVVELRAHTLCIRPLRKQTGKITLDYTALYEHALYKEAMASLPSTRRKRKVHRGRI